MLRTCSHGWLSALPVFGLTALSALNGCTIYAYSGPPRRTAASAPAAPPATTPASTPSTPSTPSQKPGTISNRSPGHPTVVTTPAPGSFTPRSAPRISSPIVFGNGNGGTFQGFAFVVQDNTTHMPNL